MHHLEVRLVSALLVRPRSLEVGRLPEMVVVEFGFEAVVRGLGEHTLLLQDGQNPHGLKIQNVPVVIFILHPPAALPSVRAGTTL